MPILFAPVLTNKEISASTAQEVQYSYTRNQIRELKSVTWSNNIYQWAGATVGTKAYTANGLNQYTAAAGAAQGYDSNGNLTGDGTWTYAYDLDNRLKTASKTGLSATLAYDAEGRLRQTAIGSTTINLLNDAERLVAEYDAAGTTVLRKYVHGPGTDEPIVWYEGAGTTAKNWLYADHLGSVVATANGTGASTATYSYGPYGEPNVATGLRFRYTGQQLIGELGLYYYKARFYSPQLGRFLQTDPIGYEDDQNLYAYVGNNAANRIDSTGQAGVLVAGGGAEAIGEIFRAIDNTVTGGYGQAMTNAVAAGNYGQAAMNLGAGMAMGSMTIGTGGEAPMVARTGEIIWGYSTHSAARLAGAGVEPAVAQAAVAAAIDGMGASLVGNAGGRITVNGTLIEFRLTVLPDGRAAVGTIFPVTK